MGDWLHTESLESSQLCDARGGSNEACLEISFKAKKVWTQIKTRTLWHSDFIDTLESCILVTLNMCWEAQIEEI
jgi:hypothetical protein